jgi:hypothetical protein
MLIQKLKEYPKVSQGGNYAAPPTTTLTAVLGQFTLSTTGADYVGPYHTMSNGDYMTGATHNRGSVQLIPITSGNQTTVVGTALVGRSNTGMTGATSTAIQPQPYVPTSGELVEYEKYRVSGSLYKSNISYVNSRDTKGNISLRENENNELLLIENISNNFTNRSIVSAIDTQFRYFKFPAQISTTIDDIEFDESLLDIDLDLAVSNDPNANKLIKTYDDKTYYVQNGKKRLFNIKASSTWAYKNNLPPFENLAGTISGLDFGENNYSNYNEVTYKKVAPSVSDGYITGDPYLPEDAFIEGDIYSKITFITAVSIPNLPSNVPVNINGPKIGKVVFSDLADGQKRRTEFVASETENSYLGIKVGAFGNTDTSAFANYGIYTTNPNGPYAIIVDYNNYQGADTVGQRDFGLVQDLLQLFYVGFNAFLLDKPTKLGIQVKNQLTMYASVDLFNSTGVQYVAYNDALTLLRKNNNTNSTQIPEYMGSGFSIVSGDNWTTKYEGLLGETMQDSQGKRLYWYKTTIDIVGEAATLQLWSMTNNQPVNNLTNLLYNSVEVPNAPILPIRSNSTTFPGWVVNFNDLFPNGITPNTHTEFEVRIATTTTFSVDVYFIGWQRQDNDAVYIINDSVHLGTPPDLTLSNMPTGPQN